MPLYNSQNIFFCGWNKIFLKITMFINFLKSIPPPPADGTLPGGFNGCGGGEHGHPGLPARGGESIPGAGQGCHTHRLRHRRHGLAQHGRQLPYTLLLLVTTSRFPLMCSLYHPAAALASVSQSGTNPWLMVLN